MSRTATFSMERLLTAVVGGFLFWNAMPLSTSTPFRCRHLHAVMPCHAMSCHAMPRHACYAQACHAMPWIVLP